MSPHTAFSRNGASWVLSAFLMMTWTPLNPPVTCSVVFWSCRARRHSGNGRAVKIVFLDSHECVEIEACFLEVPPLALTALHTGFQTWKQPQAILHWASSYFVGSHNSSLPLCWARLLEEDSISHSAYLCLPPWCSFLFPPFFHCCGSGMR